MILRGIKRHLRRQSYSDCEEITYSVVTAWNMAHPSEIYGEINNALMTGLRLYDVGFRQLNLKSAQPISKIFIKPLPAQPVSQPQQKAS
jgi:hypothetical protein